MLVDVADVLLGGARQRLVYAQSFTDGEDNLLEDVIGPERAYYLRNRAILAARALTDAVNLIRIYWTKVPA